MAMSLLPEKVWEAVVMSFQPLDGYASLLLWGRRSQCEWSGDGVTGAAGGLSLHTRLSGLRPTERREALARGGPSGKSSRLWWLHLQRCRRTHRP